MKYRILQITRGSTVRYMPQRKVLWWWQNLPHVSMNSEIVNWISANECWSRQECQQYIDRFEQLRDKRQTVQVVEHVEY